MPMLKPEKDGRAYCKLKPKMVKVCSKCRVIYKNPYGCPNCRRGDERLARLVF
jgi:hypothetical protein